VNFWSVSLAEQCNFAVAFWDVFWVVWIASVLVFVDVLQVSHFVLGMNGVDSWAVLL